MSYGSLPEIDADNFAAREADEDEAFEKFLDDVWPECIREANAAWDAENEGPANCKDIYRWAMAAANKKWAERAGHSDD